MALFINDRPMQKVLLKNTTRMSLHERFTYLRNSQATAGDGPSGSNSAVQRQRLLQQQTARNRRLAMQMERRPAVMAALKIKKKSLRQRLGIAGNGAVVASISGIGATTGSIRDRLTLGRKGRRLGRGGMVGRGGGGGLHRSPMQQLQGGGLRRGRARGGGRGGGGRLSRSQSMQSLNSIGGGGGAKFRSRSRSRSRSRVGIRRNSMGGSNANLNSLNNNNNNNSGGSGLGNLRFNRNKPIRGGGLRRQSIGGSGGGLRFNRGRGGGLRGGFRGRGGNNWASGRGGRGRGRGGNMRGGRGNRRGRGGRGGRRDNGPVPTKEELDNQLDQYMANSQYSLDKDLDTYMKEANSGMATEESWD